MIFRRYRCVHIAPVNREDDTVAAFLCLGNICGNPFLFQQVYTVRFPVRDGVVGAVGVVEKSDTDAVFSITRIESASAWVS